MTLVWICGKVKEMDKFSDEYEAPVCELAKFLYKKDIICGVSSCPLSGETCPKLILEDATGDASDAMEKLIIEYLAKEKE